MELMTISLLMLTILGIGIAANDAHPRQHNRPQILPIPLDTERM